ncbi:MAG: hypothetical protein WAT39_17955 [Planctomycetota bacterium]
MLLVSMNKALSLLLLPLCITACRTAKYEADVGPFFAIADGDLSLQNVNGTLQGFNQNDLDRNFGLGETEASPYLRLQADGDRHRIRLHGFTIAASGSGVLERDFGGIVTGSQVTTDIDFYAIGANYGYRLWNGRNYRVAIGAAAMYYGLDVAARSPVGRESVNSEVLVPMPFAEIEGLFGDFTVGANGAVMSADLGDASGRYLDVEGYVRWQATRALDFTAGYRYIVIDAAGKADSSIGGTRAFDADVSVQGYFVTAGVKF